MSLKPYSLFGSVSTVKSIISDCVCLNNNSSYKNFICIKKKQAKQKLNSLKSFKIDPQTTKIWPK